MLKLIFVAIFFIPFVQSKCSMTTFVYLESDEQVYGAISLGQSLLFTKTSADMNLLYYSFHPSPDYNALKLLRRYGWNTIRVEVEMDPKRNDTGYIKAQLAQFHPWLMTDYRMVVYLESDFVVVDNIDELCEVNAELGGVSDRYSHVKQTIGLMTIFPNRNAYNLVRDKVEQGIIQYPKEVLDTIYQIQHCPFLDPLQDTVQITKCVRYPSRYDGTIIYHLLEGWIDHNADKPKVMHYNIGDMKPWSWYSLVLLPEFWEWASSYIEVLRSSSFLITVNIIWWLILSVATILVHFLRDIILVPFKSERFKKIFQLVPSFPPLLTFHMLNFFCLWFSFFISNIRLVHPSMDLLLCVLVHTVSLEYTLFRFYPQDGIKKALIYFGSNLLFFTVLMQFTFMFSFLSRVALTTSWVVGWNAIYFTTLVF